jgi:hypothetical protein
MGQFNVVSVLLPIWLSSHLLPQMREDGKFKKWVKIVLLLSFPTRGNSWTIDSILDKLTAMRSKVESSILMLSLLIQALDNAS